MNDEKIYQKRNGVALNRYASYVDHYRRQKKQWTNGRKWNHIIWEMKVRTKRATHENDWTHFFGTVETYGINTLSTNEPKPNLKFDVIFRIVSESKSPNFDNLSLSSSIDLDKSIK